MGITTVVGSTLNGALQRNDRVNFIDSIERANSVSIAAIAFGCVD
jgi:hypothetical protein